jgi:hypothetical protein
MDVKLDWVRQVSTEGLFADVPGTFRTCLSKPAASEKHKEPLLSMLPMTKVAVAVLEVMRP